MDDRSICLPWDKNFGLTPLGETYSFTENSQEDTEISLVFHIPNTSPIILGGREFVHTSQSTEVTCRNNYIRVSISTVHKSGAIPLIRL